MKIKRILIILITGGFFSIAWFMQGAGHLENSFLQATNLSYYDVIIIMNNSAFGYSSMQAYTLFYTIPFIIMLNQFFLPEKVIHIIRSKNRDNFYLRRLLKILIVALVFSVMHSLVNLIFTYSFFPASILQEMNFIVICLYNTVGLVLFFTAVGLIYELVKDITNSAGVSFFSTILIMGGLFFVEKLFLTQIWGPIKDLVIYNKMLEKDWTTMNLLLVYVRQLFIVIFLSLIGSILFSRKDILR